MEKHNPRSRLLLPGLALLVVAVTVAVHWPVLSCQALSIDDNQYLTENPLVRKPSWSSTARFFREVLNPSTVRGYYQPLSMVSLMLDAARGGRPGNLQPFHQTSLALHALNTLLLVLWLFQLTRTPPAAALAGLLFGVHPLTVEPVAWIAERKTLLATCFALASLSAYVGYARRPGIGRYLLVVLPFLAALLAKPTTIPLPLLMLSLDAWPLRRLGWRCLLEKLPLLALAGTAGVVTVLSQAHTAAAEPVPRPAGTSLLILTHDLAFYLGKFLWPARVCGHYTFPEQLGPSHPLVVAGTLLAAGGLVLLPWLWGRWRAAPVGGLFFLLALSPTLGFVGFTNVIAADKYAYLPMAGLFLILAAGLSTTRNRSRLARSLHVAAALGALFAGGMASAATHRHYAYWRDSITLYRHMVEITPRSPIVHYNLGLLLAKQARLDEAARHFAQAVRLQPKNFRAERELGLALERLGKLDDAMKHYQAALRLAPDYTPARLGIASVLVEKGELDAALEQCEEACRRSPPNYYALDNLGRVHLLRGEAEAAESAFRQALRLRPDSPDAHYKLGLALLVQGRVTEAVEAFEQALRLDPEHALAKSKLTEARRMLDSGG